jgi:hypothetical protein
LPSHAPARLLRGWPLALVLLFALGAQTTMADPLNPQDDLNRASQLLGPPPQVNETIYGPPMPQLPLPDGAGGNLLKGQVCVSTFNALVCFSPQPCANYTPSANPNVDRTFLIYVETGIQGGPGVYAGYSPACQGKT